MSLRRIQSLGRDDEDTRSERRVTRRNNSSASHSSTGSDRTGQLNRSFGSIGSSSSSLSFKHDFTAEEQRCYEEYYLRERVGRLGLQIALLSMLAIVWALLIALSNGGDSSNRRNTALSAGVLFAFATVNLFGAVVVGKSELAKTTLKENVALASLIEMVVLAVIIFAVELMHTVVRYDGTIMVVQFVIVIYCIAPASPKYTASVCLLLSIADVISSVAAIDTSFQYADYDERFQTKSYTFWALTRLLILATANLFGGYYKGRLEFTQHSTYNAMRQLVIQKTLAEEQKGLSERILAAAMPEKAAQWLTDNSSDTLPGNPQMRPMYIQHEQSASVLFGDIVGFTKISSACTAKQLVGTLNSIFAAYDKLAEANSCEKIKILGDCYYCIAGALIPRPDHAICTTALPAPVQMRVGIHTGMVLTGVLGRKKYQFDIWSESVTISNLLEQTSLPGRVHVSETTLQQLGNQYLYEPRWADPADIPDKLKNLRTYLIIGPNKPTRPIPHNEAEVIDASYRVVFDSIDNGNRGFITPADLTKVMDHLGQDVTQQEVQTMFVDYGDVNGQLDYGGFKRAMQRRQDLAESPLITSLLKRSFGLANHDFNTAALRSMIRMKKLYRDIGIFLRPAESFNPWTLVFRRLPLEVAFRKKTAALDRAALALDLAVYLFTNILITVYSFVAVSGSCNYWALGLTCFVVPFQIMAFLAAKEHSAYAIFNWPRRLFLRHRYAHRVVAWIVVLVTFCNSTLSLACLDGAACCARDITSNSGVARASCFRGDQCSSDIGLCPQDFTSCPGGRRYPDVLFVSIILALIASCSFFRISSFLKAFVSLACVITFLVRHNIDKVQLQFDPDPGADNDWQARFITNLVFLWVIVSLISRHFEYVSRVNFWQTFDAMESISVSKALFAKYDTTLKNIVPAHVADKLKMRPGRMIANTIENVGVLFANVVNFKDFYSEDYNEGISCIRVLNEMVCQFDDAVDLQRFSMVDKIKTIGSTYMAASGLENKYTQTHNKHLEQLADFAIHLLHTLTDFNANTFGNEFVLRLGLNYGPVVAGVIGVNKMYYDIWGDTVNVASRMESTGERHYIQVTAAMQEQLKHTHEFSEPMIKRVKGKGEMTTYYLLGRKGITQHISTQLSSENYRKRPENPDRDSDSVDSLMIFDTPVPRRGSAVSAVGIGAGDLKPLESTFEVMTEEEEAAAMALNTSVTSAEDLGYILIAESNI